MLIPVVSDAFHLLHTPDPVLLWVFMMGDLNFVAAAVFIAWLLASGSALPAPRDFAEPLTGRSARP